MNKKEISKKENIVIYILLHLTFNVNKAAAEK